MMSRAFLRQVRCFSTQSYRTLALSKPDKNVVQVDLCRPQKLNSMTSDFWREMRECFDTLSLDNDCRAVVLTSSGKHFTAGLDLQDAAKETFEVSDPDPARCALKMRGLILRYQDAFNAIERCPKPVIAAVQGGCIGGGVDLVVACDIRVCSEDAFFQIKEVDLALAADVGTLQRLPRVMGNESLVRELAYTARKFPAKEALAFGLVSQVLPDASTMRTHALGLARDIAQRDGNMLSGIKTSIIQCRDNPMHHHQYHTPGQRLMYALKNQQPEKPSKN